MITIEKLSATLAKLNQGTSPRRAKAEVFATFKSPTGRQIVKMKLRGIQQSTLGSFVEADAMMLEALWNNRAQIIARLEDDCRDQGRFSEAAKERTAA